MSIFYHFYSFRMSNSEQKHSFWMSVSWKVPFIHCLRPLFLSSTHIPPIHHRQCCGNLHINAVKQLLWWRKPLPIWRERQDRLQTYMDGYYKLWLKPNMAHYERTDENHFLYTQINQKEIDVLAVTAYAGYWLLPEKLQLSANGGLNRCFNYGFD